MVAVVFIAGFVAGMAIAYRQGQQSGAAIMLAEYRKRRQDEWFPEREEMEIFGEDVL